MVLALQILALQVLGLLWRRQQTACFECRKRAFRDRSSLWEFVCILCSISVVSDKHPWRIWPNGFGLRFSGTLYLFNKVLEPDTVTYFVLHVRSRAVHLEWIWNSWARRRSSFAQTPGGQLAYRTSLSSSLRSFVCQLMSWVTNHSANFHTSSTVSSKNLVVLTLNFSSSFFSFCSFFYRWCVSCRFLSRFSIMLRFLC